MFILLYITIYQHFIKSKINFFLFHNSKYLYYYNLHITHTYIPTARLLWTFAKRTNSAPTTISVDDPLPQIEDEETGETRDMYEEEMEEQGLQRTTHLEEIIPGK